MQNRKSKAKPAVGSRRVSKSKIDGAGSNHVVTKTSRLFQPGVTDGAGWRLVWFPVEPYNSYITTPAVAGVANSYEFYRVKHASVEVIPSGGSLAVGTVMHGFINNSEIITNFPAYSDIAKADIITDEQATSICSWAFGGTKTYQQDRIASRRWYQNNYNRSTLDITETDRCVQTLYVALIRGPVSSNVAITLNFNVTFEMAGLGRVASTTFLANRSFADYPRLLFNYNTEEGWPNKVVLASRQGDKVYAIDKPDPPSKPQLPSAGDEEDQNPTDT